MTEPVSQEAEDLKAETAVFGMKVFIVSLSVLFTACTIGYLVVRFSIKPWPPPGMPPLPNGLWLSTLVLLGCSVALHFAVTFARGNATRPLRIALSLATLLGFVFLITQTVNWLGLIEQQMTIQSDLYGFTFYILTGLHAAHVIGGLFPLTLTTARAFKNKNAAPATLSVRLCAIYWHFLDVAWIVLFGVLLIGSGGAG